MLIFIYYKKVTAYMKHYVIRHRETSLSPEPENKVVVLWKHNHNVFNVTNTNIYLTEPAQHLQGLI